MNKKIITVPNLILRQKSIPIVLPVDKGLAQKYLRDLSDTLVVKKVPVGVGLALPQLGKNARLFSTYLPRSCNQLNTDRPTDDEDTQSQLQLYLNAEIVDKDDTTTLGPDEDDPILEGCLSIPGIYGMVPRANWIKMKYVNEQWQEITEVFYGFYARVVQHEYDHLEGILFTDYILKEGYPLFRRGRGADLQEIDPILAKTW